MDMLERKAEEAEANGDLASALQLWKELGQRERDPVFLLRSGRVALELEMWDEAEQVFLEALRIDPDFALVMECLGDLWATRTDKLGARSREVARSWFLKALSCDRNAHTLTLLGATGLAMGDDEGARGALTEALGLDPGNPEILCNLALAKAQADRSTSIELLEEAVDIDPQYFAAHQELGKLRHKVGDLSRAEYHFRRSLEIKPGELWSLLYLANALAAQGRIDEAEQTYRLAYQLHPNDSNGIEFFADFLQSIGKQHEADAIRGWRRHGC